jgi:DNA repair protein RadC
VRRLCSKLLDGLDREAFLVLALSAAGRFVGAHIGTLDASVVCGREVYRFAILCNAASIVVAHNHPSGNLEPSAADVAVSRKLARAGEPLGIRLLDSIVVGFDGAHTSLSARGLILTPPPATSRCQASRCVPHRLVFCSAYA